MKKIRLGVMGVHVAHGAIFPRKIASLQISRPEFKGFQ